METMSTPIGSYAPDFELPGTDHSVHHLTRYLEKFRAVGVVIMSNHCPYVRLYLDRLKQIQADFQAQGFTLVAINGNDDQSHPEEGFESMRTFAAEQRLNFPLPTRHDAGCGAEFRRRTHARSLLTRSPGHHSIPRCH